MDQLEAYTSLVKRWQREPLEWVRFTFGDNLRREGGLKTETGLTTQQEDGFRQLGALCAAKLDVYAEKMGQRVKISDETRELASKIGLSIMSGQGTGKDFFAAIAQFWFLDCFANCKNLATANSRQQLRNVYWSELSKIMALSLKLDPEDPESPTILESKYEWQSEKVYYKPKEGKRWFCEAVTANLNGSKEEQGETLAGRHEKFMLFVIDEASGLPDPVFKPLEGTMSGIINIALIIFNPTRPRGFAIDSQGPDSRFIKRRWNAEESEMVTKEHVEGMAETYGRDSNTFRIRVLGLPPRTESDTLIPWEWIEDAKARTIEPDEYDPVIQGLDVGGGGDKSVSIIRHGGRVVSIERNSSKDTMVVAVWGKMRHMASEAVASIVDMVGLGRGVYDRMRELGVRAFAGDSRGRSTDADRFKNARAEMYWRLREAFEKGTIDIPNDDDLINQLGCLKYDDEGKIQIWKKSKLRKELEGGSPDEADALALTYYFPEASFRKQPEDPYGDDDDDSDDDGSWMSS